VIVGGATVLQGLLEENTSMLSHQRQPFAEFMAILDFVLVFIISLFTRAYTCLCEPLISSASMPP
jgi:hypothetical protein